MKTRPQLRRRTFLKTLSLATPILAAGCTLKSRNNQSAARPKTRQAPKELVADLVIIGGSVGGCAAALAAARNGLRVILTEETDWIGGQLTSQAVPPDENPWIETFGGTRSYQDFRERVREFYRKHYPLTAEAKANARLNPGGGGVSRLCHEPRVALAVLNDMLAPLVASGKVQILLQHKVRHAWTTGDKVDAVLVRSSETGGGVTLHAPVFVDATEMGDLLPLAMSSGEYVTGAEAQSETGEPHAAAEANPHNMQAFTICFPLEYRPGENHTIEPPREWKFWRDYKPEMRPSWTGKLLDLTYCHPHTLAPRNLGFDPVKRTGLFNYRQIVDRKILTDDSRGQDVTLVNWPQNDYLLGNPFPVPIGRRSAERDHSHLHIERAKQLSLSLVYWLQTEAPRPDGGTGWKGLRLRPDIVGTADGLAKYPYIRESRRIKAAFTITENHVGTDARMKLLGLPKEKVRAEEFADTVGIGCYRIDLHPSTGGDNYIDVSSLPFQIPLGALIPRRVENLLPACKNLGTTHITNGCYRLHPVEWNIGESVGALAAFCQAKAKVPRQIHQEGALLKEFQDMLAKEGVPLSWPKSVFPV